MKIVVTGALGHIGSRLIRALPDSFPGAEIVLLDNLSTQRYCSLFDLPKHGDFHFCEADILKVDLEPIFINAKVVIHLAAITTAASSFNIREQVEEVNFIGTKNVAQACIKSGSAMVFLSTTSVYGIQDGEVDEECPISELKPQSPYAESKLKGELYLRDLGVEKDLRFVVCRFGTIYGTSIGMRFHTAVNKFCWQAANGIPLTIWRTAMDQKRPYLDLGDAVGALNFILGKDLYDRRTYNVLTENATVRQIINIIARYVPDIITTYEDSQIMNQLSYEVLNLRFREKGFDAVGSLENGIKNTIQLLKGVRSW